MKKDRGARALLIALLLAVACSGETHSSTGAVDAPAPTTSDLAGTDARSTLAAPTTALSPTPIGTVADAPEVASAGGEPAPAAPVRDDTAIVDEPSAVASQCVPGIPGTSQLPRLTNAQYYRTVRDMLGAAPTGLLATEQSGDITRAEWDGYRLSADQLSSSVMADSESGEWTHFGQFDNNDPSGEDFTNPGDFPELKA